MADPVIFESTTARLKLPLLFAGQAQKEFFVNEAHAMLDVLVHGAVEGEANSPPAAPVEHETWLVASAAQGGWAGLEANLAVFIDGAWKSIAPVDGMRVFDKSVGQILQYDGGWNRAATPTPPNGGTTVDTEARAAIDQLIAILRDAAILPRP